MSFKWFVIIGAVIGLAVLPGIMWLSDSLPKERGPEMVIACLTTVWFGAFGVAIGIWLGCNLVGYMSIPRVIPPTTTKETTVRELRDTSAMPTGRYAGYGKDPRTMEQVPADYYNWLWVKRGFKNMTATNPVANYISRRLNALKAEDEDLIW